MEIEISKQCEECLKRIKGKCAGKAADKEAPLYFGTKPAISNKQSGLKFCHLYEFDERLYTFDDGSRFGHKETMKVILKRKVVREKETEIHNNLNDMDLSETLSSTDLEGLI